MRSDQFVIIQFFGAQMFFGHENGKLVRFHDFRYYKFLGAKTFLVQKTKNRTTDGQKNMTRVCSSVIVIK